MYTTFIQDLNIVVWVMTGYRNQTAQKEGCSTGRVQLISERYLTQDLYQWNHTLNGVREK